MGAAGGDEALQHVGGMQAVHQVGIVVGGRAVAAEANAKAEGGHGGNVGDLSADQIDRFRAMRDAGAAAGHLPEFVVGEFPAMGIEGVGPGKAKFFQIVDRTHATASLNDRAFAFADMGMHHHAAIARQCHRFHEGLAIAIDRLAGRDHDLAHAEGAGIMIGLDQPGAVGDELVGRFQHLVRDGRAFRLRQGVAAAAGMETHAEQLGCFELTVDQPLPGVPGKLYWWSKAVVQPCLIISAIAVTEE